MREESTEKQILRRIRSKGRDSIWFPIDFSDLGSSSAIRLALYRIENDGILLRIAHGIYLYPKVSQSLGALHPTLEEVAKAIAKRDKARIIPTGNYALNKLGISTQVPMNLVYLTDGSARSIKVRNRTIKMKRTTSKMLSIKNDIVLLVVQALKELGKENVNDHVQDKIRKVLKEVDLIQIKKDLRLVPVWIATLISELIDQ